MADIEDETQQRTTFLIYSSCAGGAMAVAAAADRSVGWRWQRTGGGRDVVIVIVAACCALLRPSMPSTIVPRRLLGWCNRHKRKQHKWRRRRGARSHRCHWVPFVIWVRPVWLRVVGRPTAADIIEDETRQHTVLSVFSSGDGGATLVAVATHPSAALVADWRRWGRRRQRCGALRHRDQQWRRGGRRDGCCNGATGARGSIARGDGAATSRQCDIAAVGGTPGVHSVLAPLANKPINWLRQQHIAHHIGSDAVDGRDEGRRGSGDEMGVATNDDGGGDGSGSSTARRWFLATLPGTQDAPRTANSPFD